ncbi:MAG: hypothetical protein HDR93_04305 [Bacteroides sp.]|nr:hypothetical protein [Bacteroides sp.]
MSASKLISSIAYEIMYGIKYSLNFPELLIKWYYDYDKEQFLFSFKIKKIHFLIIVTFSDSEDRLGMSIMPHESGINIKCYNYINNLCQVLGILQEFKKVLAYFSKDFPYTAQCNYIKKNISLIQNVHPEHPLKMPNSITILANKYIAENNLVDEWGAKEIALDYLFAKAFMSMYKYFK